MSTQNITESTFFHQNISQHSVVITPGRTPEALLWIIVDAFLLVAIVTGNSLSIAIILRTRRRRTRKKKSKVKGPIQRTKSKCSQRKHPNEMRTHSSDHKRKGPEDMVGLCRRPSRSSCFVLSLAISDLLVGLAMPFHMTFYIQGADKDGSIRQDEGIILGEIEWTCLLRFVLIALACSASACNLLAIAVDRYLAIVYPLHYNRYMNRRVAVALIFSCWVSALALSTVPAYWNRWKTATECELDEIFTPQYITCVVPPLFSAVMVALTILYWRIGKEAHAQLSRLLGADGKGPPWRRSQSGKTYCPSISSHENRQENGKTLNPQKNIASTEQGNSSEAVSLSSKSGFLTQQDIMQSHALQQTGANNSATEEGSIPKLKDERHENYYDNLNNFHTLYKIEEESDIMDDDESGLDSLKRGSRQLSDHHTIHIEHINGEKLEVNDIDEPVTHVEKCGKGNTSTKEVFGCLSKGETTDDQILQRDNKSLSHNLEEFKKPKEGDITISRITHENSFAKTHCPNKCITRAIQNLKGHFHTIALGTNIRRIPHYSNVSAAYDPGDNMGRLNNDQSSEKKAPISPDETCLANIQQAKLITQVSLYDCQKANEPTLHDLRVDQDFTLKNASDTIINNSKPSHNSRELILCVNSLDLVYDEPLKSQGDTRDDNTNTNNIKAQYNTYKDDIIKDLSNDFEPLPRSELQNETFKTKESILHDCESIIQGNQLNINTSKSADTSEDEVKKEKQFSNDFQPISQEQKDKNEHQPIKKRSSSCSSQDDPRSNTWNIRFPSLASAGTTVRPLSKSTIVVLLVLGTFLLLWLPYIIVCGLLVNGYHLPYIIYRATFSLAMSNSGVNPIIYGWKNAELKRVFLRFIFKKWYKCQSKYRKEEQDTELDMESQEFTDTSINAQKF